MKNQIQVVTDGEDPLLLRFFLNGRECLNGTALEIRAMGGIWIPCVFHYEENRNYDGLNIKTPFVLVWFGSHQTDIFESGKVSASIMTNVLDAQYRWSTSTEGGRA